MKTTRKALLAQVGDFEIRLLRLFKTVVECGSFTAAEGRLGITRSAISLHMNDLEKRLGMRLCQRGRAGFSLTDEGREVLNQLHQHLRGELNLRITNNLLTQPRMRITHALAALKRAAPGVVVNIGMTLPGEIETGVLDGHLHLGVLPLINALAGLDYLPLYEERALLYCSRSHPLFAVADAALDESVLAAQDAVDPNHLLNKDGHERHAALNCTARASDREGVAFLMLTGCYIGYLPDHVAQPWVVQGQLRALNNERFHFDTPLAAVTPNGRRPDPGLERLLEALAETV